VEAVVAQSAVRMVISQFSFFSPQPPANGDLNRSARSGGLRHDQIHKLEIESFRRGEMKIRAKSVLDKKL
jgi:hypothetical protein